MGELDAAMSKVKMLWQVVGVLSFLLIGVVLVVLSSYLSGTWAVITRDLGFVFAPVAVLSLLYRIFVEPAHAKEIAERVVSYIRKDVLAVYPKRRYIDFNSFFGSARNEIDILVTNLRSLQLHSETLIEKAKNNVSIRVLALNPNHSFVANRAPELRFGLPEHFREDMIVSLRHFYNGRGSALSEKEKQRYTIKCYENPPSLMLFRSDERLIIGFILRQGHSSDQMHIEFRCTKEHDLVKHFDMVFNEADELDGSMLSVNPVHASP